MTASAQVQIALEKQVKAVAVLDAFNGEAPEVDIWKPLAELVGQMGGFPATAGAGIRLRAMPSEFRAIYLFALLAAQPQSL